MNHTITGRRTVLGALVAAPWIGSARAQARSVTLAVGSSIVNYVPAPMAVKLGYFKAEGLDVQAQDFQAGGSKALQALMAGRWTSSSAPTTTPSPCRPRASGSWEPSC